MSTPLPADLVKRWILFGLLAVAGGELAFALISGTLDRFGDIADKAGHFITLIPLGAVILYAQHRALNQRASWRAALVCGACTVAAYIGGFTFFGPPMDFLLSLIVTGFATGIALWLTLRRGVPGAGWVIPAVGLGYAVGAGLGVGAAILFGDQVDHLFGSGVTGFMGVVSMIGVIAGAFGSVISGLALGRILGPTMSQTTAAPTAHTAA